MPTGNHGQLRLPGKFDSLSISALTSARLQSHRGSSLLLSAASQRGSVPQSPLAAAIDGEASLP